jgi:hypothetical protein
MKVLNETYAEYRNDSLVSGDSIAPSIRLGDQETGLVNENPSRRLCDLTIGAPSTPPKKEPIELKRMPPRVNSPPSRAKPVNSYALAAALSRLFSLRDRPAG